jgi:hypothetical protein
MVEAISRTQSWATPSAKPMQRHRARTLNKEGSRMLHRTIASIVTIPGCIVLTILIGGCAAKSSGPTSSLSDPAAAVSPGELRGTWRGEVWPIGTDSTSVLNSDAMLEIKNDATYRLTSTRRGTASNESGVVVQDGTAVILRSSTGYSTRLVRNGERLYGVMASSGRNMNIMLQKAQ